MRQRFRLIQHGIPVAWAEGSDALREIAQYATVYSQDAPVRVECHARGKWRVFKRDTPNAERCVNGV